LSASSPSYSPLFPPLQRQIGDTKCLWENNCDLSKETLALPLPLLNIPKGSPAFLKAPVKSLCTSSS
jgi:hypothetical protein